jgi:hypothetical protein
MPLTLSDLPALTAAAQDLLQRLTSAIGPDSESGRRVSRAELLAILDSAGRLILAVVAALAD